jgi:hypothetical protein
LVFLSKVDSCLLLHNLKKKKKKHSKNYKLEIPDQLNLQSEEGRGLVHI